MTNLTFTELRHEINNLYARYGDELGDIVVRVEDEYGIIADHVTEVTTAGSLVIIIEGQD